VKPPVAGATLGEHRRVVRDERAGLVKVVSKGNYVAVVCEREEQAIQAARQLKVNWQKPATAPFPASEDLFRYMRRRRQPAVGNPVIVGQPDAGVRQRREVVEADYEIPFQGHVSIGPAHAMADPSNDQ
jgi:alkanesulfonate monooxygenase SsuD/methylene tetrahydromethanopterin reductase-like flavin-dependent oxidoreductase (luciferase family)